MRIISGLRRGLKLSAPPGRETRPVLDRVKKSWFDVLGNRVESSRAVDIYCGVGSLGLEALSRGAVQCVFIEAARDCVALLEKHLERTGFGDRATVMPRRAEMALGSLIAREEKFDCIFLDPPFAAAAEPGFYAEGSVLDLTGRVLAPDGLLMLRREGPGKKRKYDLEPDDLPGLKISDRRQWGRNEILFLQLADARA